MPIEHDIRQLVEEALDLDRPPDEVCRDCPELLDEVRRQWERARAVEAQLDALFPGADAPLPEDAAIRDDETGLPRVEGYDVEAVICRGGMGIVYRACHRKLNRPVALIGGNEHSALLLVVAGKQVARDGPVLFKLVDLDGFEFRHFLIQGVVDFFLVFVFVEGFQIDLGLDRGDCPIGKQADHAVVCFLDRAFDLIGEVICRQFLQVGALTHTSTACLTLKLPFLAVTAFITAWGTLPSGICRSDPVAFRSSVTSAPISRLSTMPSRS